MNAAKVAQDLLHPYHPAGLVDAALAYVTRCGAFDQDKTYDLRGRIARPLQGMQRSERMAHEHQRPTHPGVQEESLRVSYHRS